MRNIRVVEIELAPQPDFAFAPIRSRFVLFGRSITKRRIACLPIRIIEFGFHPIAARFRHRVAPRLRRVFARRQTSCKRKYEGRARTNNSSCRLPNRSQASFPEATRGHSKAGLR
jgi:hypothetical protein